MQRVKDASPEAVYIFIPGGAQPAAIGKALAERGLTPPATKILAQGELTHPEALESMGDTARGIITTFHYTLERDDPMKNEFVAAYQAANNGRSPDLFSIGGHLATPDPDKVRKALARAELAEGRVAEFERIMDVADAELPALRAFVLPAGTPKAAALHLARTVCRRAERSVIHLGHEAEVPELFVVYLNRLSDLLFTLARLANHRAGSGDVVW